MFIHFPSLPTPCKLVVLVGLLMGELFPSDLAMAPRKAPTWRMFMVTAIAKAPNSWTCTSAAAQTPMTSHDRFEVQRLLWNLYGKEPKSTVSKGMTSH